MTRVATLTLNPAIDGSCETKKVRHTHKVRTANEKYEAGGGGINVARVVHTLGGDALAVYLAGGVTGGVLDSLLDAGGIKRHTILISDDTRMSLAVHETSTNREYRFVPEGPDVSEDELRACLGAVDQLDADWFVVSGSLPPGVDPGFYCQLSDRAASRGMRFVLDTSGAALKTSLNHGGVFLVKPSLNELEQFFGQPLRDVPAIEKAVEPLITSGRVENVAVTMGHEGAMLISAEHKLFLPAIPVEAKSAVGAGDSFLGSMVWALAEGWTVDEAFRLGLAGGTAAVMCPGTGLCSADDVHQYYRDLKCSVATG